MNDAEEGRAVYRVTTASSAGDKWAAALREGAARPCDNEFVAPAHGRISGHGPSLDRQCKERCRGGSSYGWPRKGDLVVIGE